MTKFKYVLVRKSQPGTAVKKATPARRVLATRPKGETAPDARR